VLHYPGKEKDADFYVALTTKLDAQDFNFDEVWFPYAVHFSNFTFTKPASFRGATFGAVAFFSNSTFSADAFFDRATFSEVAYFNSVTFSVGVGFRDTTFNADVSFSGTAFGAMADFGATFNALADFEDASFRADADFMLATFKDYVSFAGSEKNAVFSDNSSLTLYSSRIEKPDRLSFHTLTLRPHWFTNVDARKFEFINVNWNWQHTTTKQEIKSLKKEYVSSVHRLLAIACRNLAVNAEENHRYEEASRFRYMAMEAQRLESWRGFVPWKLSWWYWLASGYGERAWRAFVVLIGVWMVAAALYTQVGFVRWEPRVSNATEAWEARRDEVGQPLRWQRAVTYSLGVMTLQKPEPRPATDAAQAVVMLETILGPVQAALLALAIRRKFMR
jgi:hypothetical protein